MKAMNTTQLIQPNGVVSTFVKEQLPVYDSSRLRPEILEFVDHKPVKGRFITTIVPNNVFFTDLNNDERTALFEACDKVDINDYERKYFKYHPDDWATIKDNILH
jgi:hypothetical protein